MKIVVKKDKRMKNYRWRNEEKWAACVVKRRDGTVGGELESDGGIQQR